MTTVEQALTRTGLYRPTRNLYQRLLNRAYYNERRQGRVFYGQFVKPGNLVFDLGANKGLMSEMFLELGAKVVAVEPIPDLAALIRSRYRVATLHVEAVAVGAEPGEATMRLGVDSIHSTISDEWVGRVEQDIWPDRWAGAITVPVTTLDDLIGRHGIPQFVKIDVEGFEDHVLNGLTTPVRALSFEFQCPALDMAQRCLDRLDELGNYRFRYSAGESLAFLPGDWMPAAALMEKLETRRENFPVTHGDVYAVHRHSWNS
jgi:FkbM family methyltransferase